MTLHDAGHTYSPEYVASSLDFVQEYTHVCSLLGADDRVSLQVTTEQHGYVYEMRRATYAWFNRWFEMKDAGDDETSQAVETDQTLFVTPTGFVTTSLGGETALSLTRQLAAAIQTPASPRSQTTCARASSPCSASRRPVAMGWRPACSPPSASQDTGQNSSSSRAIDEIRTPGWLLTPDNAGPSDAHSAVRRRGGGVELGR